MTIYASNTSRRPIEDVEHSTSLPNSNGKPVAFQPLPVTASKPPCDPPGIANFDCSHLVIGAGVAIFHLASSRVVLCRHSVKKWWFLPKGRRDASEETGIAAEREGFEEVRPCHINLSYKKLTLHSFKTGYRNRLLPIPLRHRQPRAHNIAREQSSSQFVTEPVWTQLVPQTHTAQYMLFWYIAETVPSHVETELNARTTEFATVENPTPYQIPSKYAPDMTLTERMKLDVDGYMPLHHPNTGVNSEEALYESHLLPVDEAIEKLKGTVMADVIRSGWEAICLRDRMESQTSSTTIEHD